MSSLQPPPPADAPLLPRARSSVRAGVALAACKQVERQGPERGSPTPRSTRPVRAACAAAVRALFSVVFVLGLASSGGDGIDEYHLKAAFLSKFVKYVTWPTERTTPSDAPFVVGVLGADPFGSRLDETFKGRKLEDHPIVVRRFATLDGIAAAHVLFVPEREAKDLELILELTASAGVLLVGESDGFASDGGIVNFFVDGDKLRFEVNTDSAKRQKLKVSSDLLKVARIVTDRK